MAVNPGKLHNNNQLVTLKGSNQSVKSVSLKSGFVRRSQKCRPQMRELFQNLSEHLDVYDHTTFERAILALIEKEGTEEHLSMYKDIVK